MKIKTGEYTGSSSSGINEAIQDALQKAGGQSCTEVIETRSSQIGEEKPHYQVIISTYAQFTS